MLRVDHEIVDHVVVVRVGYGLREVAADDVDRREDAARTGCLVAEDPLEVRRVVGATVSRGLSQGRCRADAVVVSFRMIAVRPGLLVSFAVLACAQRVPDPTTEVTPTLEPTQPIAAAPPSAETTAPEQRPFAWDRVLVIGTESLGGPGTAGAAKVGQELAVMVGDGAPITARVVDVVRDGCDEGGPPATCLFVGVELGREDDAIDPESLPSLWRHPGGPEEDSDAGFEDLALLEARLAVTSGTSLPRFVPHSLEVHYTGALCEGDVDAKDFVLLRSFTSAAPDPVKDDPALRDWRRVPRRVVTLRAVDRTLHFVTASKVQRPRSKRMADVPAKYDSAFWILEQQGNTTKVLHHERQEIRRDIDQDVSCQLPLRYPTPWTVVEHDGVVHVLTRTGITGFARWSLRPDRLVLEGEWQADINPLG